MKLDYATAMKAGLIKSPLGNKKQWPVLHFGVGGFHRAHQAWALQKLRDRQPEGYGDLGICGVSILPGDIPFVEKFHSQDCLYFVQTFTTEGTMEECLVSAVRALLHPAFHYQDILDRIADAGTRVISFTITEGGYNVDYNKKEFIWSTPEVQQDIKKEGPARTVFGILSEGLRRRRDLGNGAVALMSCDNVQNNGEVLRFALLEFLKKYDPDLIEWVEGHVRFIKTMVDRITPVTAESQKKAFEAAHGFKDDCLVVCEDFFQWVIEDDPSLLAIPYEAMGATLVKDVAPYEKMKLRLLNGGHSLTGLLGELLGYDRIHTAIGDPLIREVYKRYCQQEVMDTLEEIKGVDYERYRLDLERRFANPLINDSTARIISGSTDKLPKFVFPVIEAQLGSVSGHLKWGVLILASWYCYLQSAFVKDQMASVEDLNKASLLALMQSGGVEPANFWDRLGILESIRKGRALGGLFVYYVSHLVDAELEERRAFIQELLDKESQ